MSELIERLRKLSAENPSPRDCIDEAADELERLYFQLDCTEQALRDRTESARCGWAAATAADKDRERLTKQRDELIHTMRHIVKAVPTLRNMYIGKRKERSVAGVLMDAIANSEGKKP